MLKLIRLEWKKNRIGKYCISVIITTALLCVFIYSLAFLGIANDPDGKLDAAEGMSGISASIELFASIAFLIFTSVMLGNFIISAYKNKTMNVMFSYPIKRQKILVSQMMAVWLFNMAALIFTKLCLYICVYEGSKHMTSSFDIDFNMGSEMFYVQLLAKSVVTVTMSFISLFVGMTLKSSKAAVISSFLLIFLTQANVGDFSMKENAALPIILTAISLGFAGLSVRNAEKKDLMW